MAKAEVKVKNKIRNKYLFIEFFAFIALFGVISFLRCIVEFKYLMKLEIWRDTLSAAL